MKQMFFLIPLILLSACASNKPVVVQMPRSVPGTTLATDDMESVRYGENLKAYSFGRYVDPNDGLVNPFDAKGRIVEDHVDSFHVTVNPEGNNSKLRCFSRAEYEAARNEAEGNNGAPGVTLQTTEPTPAHAQAG